MARVGQEVGAGLGPAFLPPGGAFPGAEGTLAVVVEGQAVAQRFQAEQQAADFIVALHVRRGSKLPEGDGAKVGTWLFSGSSTSFAVSSFR